MWSGDFGAGLPRMLSLQDAGEENSIVWLHTSKLRGATFPPCHNKAGHAAEDCVARLRDDQAMLQESSHLRGGKKVARQSHIALKGWWI